MDTLLVIQHAHTKLHMHGAAASLCFSCTPLLAVLVRLLFASNFCLRASCIAHCGLCFAAQQGEIFGLVVAQSTENRLVLSSTKYGFFLVWW